MEQLQIKVQVIETHAGFSDACWNGLIINLSFVPKPKSVFDHGWRSVSFRNSLLQSSFRGPSSHPVVLQKRLLSQYVGVCRGENLLFFKLQRLECLQNNLDISCLKFLWSSLYGGQCKEEIFLSAKIRELWETQTWCMCYGSSVIPCFILIYKVWQPKKKNCWPRRKFCQRIFSKRKIIWTVYNQDWREF